ncbi:hypothetical protein [Staphylococcus haemolyticus]|uniref:hypothetical protein n=1 Tax=Staphylococcus haemolyticus TaxID=1283 RepID=UPI0029053C2A|nr:hypothetical protein [Staphylococcus haemolyticus]MDU0485370.1 hypothetical protein [Staphylococcus haemolyticus]
MSKYNLKNEELKDLSLEVKAQEIHERAVGFYKISEQYGYKFLMEVKKIRDEKLFKELGYKNFEEYTLNCFGYSNDTINQRIRAANEFGESYNDARSSFGNRKTNLLATMPKEQREDVIRNGIETKDGQKPIEEVTTRELEDYKKRTKTLEQQNAQLQSRIKEREQELKSEKNKSKEVKMEYKEVIPDKVKKQLDQIENNKKLLQQKEKENREIRKKLRKQQEELRKQQDKSNEQFIQDGLSDEEIISRQRVLAETNLLEIKEYTDEFLNKVSINTFRDAAIAKSSQRTKNMIYESAEEVIRWAESIKNKINTNSFVEDANFREEF